jgi:cytochrome c
VASFDEFLARIRLCSAGDPDTPPPGYVERLAIVSHTRTANSTGASRMQLGGLAMAMALLVLMPVARAQNSVAGEKVFARCRPCHMVGLGAKNGVGPSLNGLVGRPSGSVEGYGYSDANRNAGLTWDESTFKDYIHNPRAKIPGTKKMFSGLASDEDIANIWAYLGQFDPDGQKHP